MTESLANSDWQWRDFVNALSAAPLPRRPKLQARNYRNQGSFQVIDQGQADVAGWTDDESLVIAEGLPYVVFGDHTRAFKYVDHPFALGADGTQLLKPSNEYCPRFFYYACLQLDLPSRGYNRHYTFLKEKELPLPDRSEQEMIAAILWKLQRAIATQDSLMTTTRELKEAAMAKLFTKGFSSEVQKETEAGMMPLSWAVKSIGDIASIGSGGTPARGNPAYWHNGTIPWVKTGEVDYCVITDTEEKITEEGMAESAAKLYPAGTLLVAMYGQGITRGKVALLGIDATTNQACAAIRLTTDTVLKEFLYHTLTFSYERLRGLAHGGQQQNLNADLIRGFTFGLPSTIAEQHQIADALTTIDHKINHHQRKRVALNDLFQTLLHMLMTAEIRVHDLDIDTTAVAAPAA